jgi:hypothetical protein
LELIDALRLLHEVQTRREDWQAGALPAAYMRIKLERAGKGVSALEIG